MHIQQKITAHEIQVITSFSLSGKLGDIIGALPTYILMSIGQTVKVLGFPYIDLKVGLFILAAAFGFTYSGVMKYKYLQIQDYFDVA